jgi:hypothetical protein
MPQRHDWHSVHQPVGKLSACSSAGFAADVVIGQRTVDSFPVCSVALWGISGPSPEVRQQWPVHHKDGSVIGVLTLGLGDWLRLNHLESVEAKGATASKGSVANRNAQEEEGKARAH